jgi:signal peptidase I
LKWGLITVDVEKRRYPIVAFLLSLVMPGLGQVYNGRPIRGLVFLAAWPTILLIGGLVGAGYSFRGLAIVMSAVVVWVAAVATDAMLLSRKLRVIPSERCSRWYTYFCFLLAFVFVCPSIVLLQYHVLGIRTFNMPSASMEPTLKIGDHLVTRLQPYQNEKPQRGDIVAFIYPQDRSKYFTKRIIAFGGEKLEIQNKQVFINGEPIEEPYKQHVDEKVLPGGRVPRDNLDPITIPEGSVFVMGDNRDYSLDSRFFGPVPVGDLEAKALYTYWSNDLSRIGSDLK